MNDHDKLKNFITGAIVGVLFLSLIYWLSGCASTSRITILEAKVDALTQIHMILEKRTNQVIDHSNRFDETANSYFEIYNQFVSTTTAAIINLDSRLKALETKRKK